MDEFLFVGSNEFRIAWSEKSVTTIHIVGKKVVSKRIYERRASSHRTAQDLVTVPFYHWLFQGPVGWLEFTETGEMLICFEPAYEHLGA
jgi:hypothetical protein